MAGFRVVDCNTAVGTLPYRGSDMSVAALRRLMERNQVGAALVSSLDALTYNDGVGNRAAIELCRAEASLFPVAAVMPGAGIDWRVRLTAELDAGCRLVKLYVEEHRWSPRSRSFVDLVDLLGGRAAPVPLMLVGPPVTDIASFAGATSQAGLPVILAGTNYAALGECIAVMERWPHVLLETSRMASHGALELIAQTVGARRVVFGSGAPFRPVAAALNAVRDADLPEADKRAILGETIARLAGIDVAGLVVGATRTRRYRGTILDAHTHLGAGTWRFPIPSSGAGGLTSVLRGAGIERAIASSMYAITTDLLAGNDLLAAAVVASPGLYGYVTVSPQFPERSVTELERLSHDPKMVGVKVHAAYSRTPTTSPAMRRLFELIAPYGRPVKIHNDGAGWMPALAEIARAHPELPVIVAHGGEWGSGAYFRELPNVYFEFCSSMPEQGLIDDCLDAVGPRRVLFGSDADLLSPHYVLGTYADAEISEEVAPLIYYDNAARLFRLSG